MPFEARKLPNRPRDGVSLLELARGPVVFIAPDKLERQAVLLSDSPSGACGTRAGSPAALSGPSFLTPASQA